MTNTQSFAANELDILSASHTDPNNRPLIEEFREEMLALCEKFGKSGQSGGSAPYTATALSQAIKKLCLQEPICPVTGIDEEWVDMSDYDKLSCFQNSRCSALFKHGKDGMPYYLDAIVWKGDTEGESGNDWDTFTGNVEGIKSRQFLQGFPFTPKTFYIDVTREMLPEDWNQEPFIENEFYDTKIFEETGVREWKKEKYRYLIKDKNQLEKVWKYYKKPF